jgi:hypothetical protein
MWIDADTLWRILCVTAGVLAVTGLGLGLYHIVRI